MNNLALIQYLSEWSFSLLIKAHIPHQTAVYLHVLLLLTCFLLVAWAADKAVNVLLTTAGRKSGRRKAGPLIAIMIRNKVIRRAAHLVSLTILTYAVPVIFGKVPEATGWFEKLMGILLVLLVVSILNSVFKSLTELVKEKPGFRDKPMDSYLQVVNIILIFVAGILIFSQLTGKSVWAFFTAMGALSAILLLVFKDTIMGFVASIQVTTNDMVRIGDWIEMPKYGADGDVVAITLNTVKIRNWDKTITTIPTYALISDSFKNWRGMQESGGRRMKRSIYLKISSVRFLEDEDIERYKKISLVREYLTERKAEIDAFNQSAGADKSVLINGRNFTNIGVFRQYIMAYLKNAPGVNRDMIMMVRQLAPTETGLPMEIYAFTDTVAWVKHEGVMADIFDHIMVAATYFDLEIFEAPSGGDLRNMRAGGEALLPARLSSGG